MEEEGQAKPLAIKVVANRLLKALVQERLLADIPSNKTLQCKKQERIQQRNEFLNIEVANNILLVQKILSDNILVPVNADGDVISAEEVSLNTGARVIMLAVETEPSFEYLSDNFRAPEKSDRKRQIDDDTLSFDQKWNNLANNFMNADDFMPKNIWREKSLGWRTLILGCLQLQHGLANN
jgi:hypothetical protein